MPGQIRLTLRTLLAYLDDALEPDQAQVIGQKIAESDVARKLIDRIKAVTHNRQLPAPMVAGPGAKVDANVIAEYLDSVLEVEKLAELEEILLKSDVLLAEVAAGHQILSMYLSQPTAVSPRVLERMYGLVQEAKPKPKPGRTLPPLEDEEEEDELENEEEEEEEENGEEEDEGEEEADDASIGAPLKVRRRRVAVLPLLAVVAVLGVAAYLAWHALQGGPAATTLASVAPPPTGPSDKTDDATKKATQPEKLDVPPVEKKEEPPVEKKEPPPDKKVEEKKQPIDQLPENKPSLQRQDAGRMLQPLPTQPAALLRRQGAGPWLRVKPEERVQTTDRLVSLPGYRSRLQLGGVELTLAGQLPEFAQQFDPMLESSVILHVPELGIDADLTLDHGRILLANLKGRGEAKVRVRLAGEIWDLALLDNQSVAAVELWGYHPPEVPFRPQPGTSDGPLLLANVYGLKGQTELKIRYQTFALPTPSILPWNNRSGVPPGPQPQDKPPPWYTDAAPPAGPMTRDLRAALDDLDARLAKKPVEVALTELRKEPKPAAKLLAVRALGAVDAIGELMDVLADDKDPISRHQAIFVLRHWIGRNADNETALFQLLPKKGYTLPQAETIMELLHTFSADARGNPITYEKLIANLRHDKLAIRQLSIWHLAGMVPEGQKIPYDPAGNLAQADEAIKQWKKLIPDGKLPPAPKK